MKIACLQFAPKLGRVQENIRNADAVLAEADLVELDLLVLPEMAFSGYNFPSLGAILPFLEPTSSGISTAWARRTARRLNCNVTVGYPEVGRRSELPSESGTIENGNAADLAYYNSTVTVSPAGDVLAHYRKTFLYYTDVTWASEGSGFFAGPLPLTKTANVSMQTALGICMDLNPYRFMAPWDLYEFANHVIESEATHVVLSMAWLSHTLDVAEVRRHAKEPDWETIAYWVERFKPLFNRPQDEKGVVLAMANRVGVEGEAVYAGTSTVMIILGNEVHIWNVLGKGEERCLVVDTSEPPLLKF